MPLLDGVELSVSAGERVCLVGRNGSGKSTLLKIAAGLIEPDRGERFVQPGASVRYLPQEPDFAGHATTLAYVEAGLGASDDRASGALPAAAARPQRRRGPGAAVGRRSAPRRARPRAGAAARTSCCSTSRPTTSTCRPSNGWRRRSRRSAAALVLISHDRRFLENLSRTTVWLDRGQARRVEIGFGSFEAWRDEKLAEEEVAAAQARPQDRARGALGALRRHRRGASATCGAWPSCRRCGRRGASYRGAAGKAVIAAGAGGEIRRAGDRGQGHRQVVRRRADRRRFLDAHHARRPHRHRRAERQRQDHAGQPAHRRARARQRRGQARRQPRDGGARAGPRQPRSRTGR